MFGHSIKEVDSCFCSAAGDTGEMSVEPCHCMIQQFSVKQAQGFSFCGFTRGSVEAVFDL